MNLLRSKSASWQQHFPWHIAFWGASADVMPMWVFRIPIPVAMCMSLGADKLYETSPPTINSTAIGEGSRGLMMGECDDRVQSHSRESAIKKM